jgi:hypothetical protein
MAPGATIEIEARPQTVRNGIDFLKNTLRRVKKLQFSIVQALQRPAYSGVSASHTRVGAAAT